MLVSQEAQSHLHTLAGQVMTTEVKLYQKSKSSNLYIKYLYMMYVSMY